MAIIDWRIASLKGAVMLAVCAGALWAQTPTPAPATTALGQKAALQWTLMEHWRKMPDTEGTAPFTALYEMAPGEREFVVYRPKDIAAASKARKLGVYIWGNGGCGRDGAVARFHLIEMASRGFVAIAPGRIESGPKADPQAERATGDGGSEDIAEPNALNDFKRISAVPVFLADHPGAGHVGLFLEPHGEATKVELDWLLWQLDGDQSAARSFVGKDCGLCRDFRWVVYRKGIQ